MWIAQAPLRSYRKPAQYQNDCRQEHYQDLYVDVQLVCQPALNMEVSGNEYRSRHEDQECDGSYYSMAHYKCMVLR